MTGGQPCRRYKEDLRKRKEEAEQEIAMYRVDEEVAVEVRKSEKTEEKIES